MKILSVAQMREADLYTIEEAKISPIELMERASEAFVEAFVGTFPNKNNQIYVIAGLGDNGGDGMVIARLLLQQNYRVKPYVLVYGNKKSTSFQINLERLEQISEITYIHSEEFFPHFNPEDIIIDAIFGSGLSRKLSGLTSNFVHWMNQASSSIVSVDIPSGLLGDVSNEASDVIVRATHTITFQSPKLTFLLPQSAVFVGDWQCVDIGLDKNFIENCFSHYYFTEEKSIEKLLKKRGKFSHKGTYGHGLLVAGCQSMMGAALLSAKACMRSGIGKLTVHSVLEGKLPFQIYLPEAIYWEGKRKDVISTDFNAIDFLETFQAVAIGPGIGVANETAQSLFTCIEWAKLRQIPLVIDADALNLLAMNPVCIPRLPAGTILTPHPKEFQRLLGISWKNDFEKIDLLQKFCQDNNLIVCLKGAYTAVALPNGEVHFNSSGNPGMAKAGSGDVLTGMVLAFLAQGYIPEDAARLAVFLHGKAGDFAAEKRGMNNMIAGDIIENIRF